MSNTARNNVKQLAANIENLAKEFQLKIENGEEFLSTANEIARNSQTFVFSLGEFYALRQSGTNNAMTGTKVKGGTNTNWHNLRDNRGRFKKKI